MGPGVTSPPPIWAPWAGPFPPDRRQGRAPGQPLVVVTGDGCMLMHGIEIQTAARYGIAAIFVVINNGALGNVWLRAIKEGPGPAALTEIPVHDWAGFARSLGLKAATVHQPEELAPAFEAGPGGRRPVPGGRALRPGLHHAGNALQPGQAGVGRR